MSNKTTTKQPLQRKKNPKTLTEYNECYSCMNAELKELREVYQHVNEAREVINKRDNQLSTLVEKYDTTRLLSKRRKEEIDALKRGNVELREEIAELKGPIKGELQETRQDK